ncbi:DUF6628 family protein [Pontixanthobacter aquaemixtae]|uniref:Uncharacterized protein n=1 Tax=Pontixanthobacter aquaemixtae TaxID=1958940 RepID=A0A844ZQQ6_9SPHN|nr:DUF6628 family protein [Pontixanthobacter aquaemixtae]MXO90661.1 hypothetical protein [Pontixanthobacter aquaemixtae]
MSRTEKTGQPVLLPKPHACTDRAILVMLRRMGGHGLRDATACMLAMRHFGTGFRQPLTLMRCFVAELAQGSRRSISIANCCGPMMTQDEALVLESLALSNRNPDRTMRNLGRLTGNGLVGRSFTIARAMGTALDNMGMPLEG